MANNLRKFNTYSDYEAAELVKPAVSLIASDNSVYFDQFVPEPPVLEPTLNGYEIAIVYNIADPSEEALLFYDGYYQNFVTAMEIDGVSVTPSSTYRFSTAGEHTVRYNTKLVDSLPKWAFGIGPDGGNVAPIVKVRVSSKYSDIQGTTFIGNPSTSTGNEYLIFECTSPAQWGDGIYNYSSTIYVPAEAVDTYKAVWSPNVNQIQAIPE